MAEKKKRPQGKAGRPKRGGSRISETDVVQIERLYLQNIGVREIAERFGVRRGTIQYHINSKIRPSLKLRMEANREVEYAKVDLLEKIAWDRFEESKNPQRRSTVESKVFEPAEKLEKEAIASGADPKVVKRILTKIGRTGEASWLQIVQWCIDWRARIRGDYAAQKHEHIVSAGDLRIAGITPEQFTREMLVELLGAIEEAEKKRQDQNAIIIDVATPQLSDAGTV